MEIFKEDDTFPPLLKQIPDCPKKLFCLGQILKPSDRYFAIVGTRRATPYGLHVAEEFSKILASTGFVIVSGLAYGIDAAAHRGALAVGGRTIAVLGAGFNHITPYANRPLANEIQKTGSVITEFERDFPPHKGTFPQRNRIIAGMSLATLIIEAPESSGALITARLALEYHREVYAVPGNITHEMSKGSNLLIQKSGAYIVTSVEDIFENMKISFSEPHGQIPLPLLNENEERVYSLLKQGSRNIDELVLALQLPAEKIIATLSLLELKHLIRISGAYAFVTR